MSPTQFSNPVTIAVIGTGLIGPRHADAIHEEADAELFCIVDPNPAAKQVASRLDVAWYGSISDMLRLKGKPDGALVCTPNSSHVVVSKELIDVGVHVLCEKPLATSVEDGKDLVQYAKSKNVKLLAGHHRRFNSYVSATKDLIAEQKLGRLIAVSGFWTAYKPPEYFEPPTDWRKGSSGGPVLINLIHEVDILQFLLGPIVRVHAERTISQRGFEAEEGAALLFRFQNGVVGSFILSDAVPSPHNFESGTGENPLIPKTGCDVYRILGSEGTVSVPDMQLWNYEGSETKSWMDKLQSSRIEIPEVSIPFKLQVKNFVAVIRGSCEPICSGEDGLRAVVVCDAVKQALDTGMPVNIDL